MILKVNGKEMRFDSENNPATIELLLKQLKIDQAAVVAEVDSQIIERNRFTEFKLQDGQSIELVTFVGGG